MRTGARIGHAHVAYRQLTAVTVLVLVAWTQLFLGVHELSHLGQRDASACRFTLVASTVGGADVPVQAVLVVPSVPAADFAPPLTKPVPGVLSVQRARAPPVLA